MSAYGFQVEIVMDGLLAFVASKHRNSMQVILLNAMSPDPAEYGHMPPHYPFLRFRSIYEAVDNRPPDLRIGNSFLAYFFDWQEMCLITDGDALKQRDLIISDGRRANTSEPFTPDEERDFSWVAEVERISPGCGVAHPVVTGIDPPHDLVLGRLTLGEGRISTLATVKRGDSNALFAFQPKHPEPCPVLCQALASKVIYTVFCRHATYLYIAMHRFGSPDPPTSVSPIRLKPKGGKIKLEVANVPAEDMLLRFPDPRLIRDPASHLGLLYNLCTKAPEGRPLPYMVQHPQARGGGAHASDSLCPGISLSSSQ